MPFYTADRQDLQWRLRESAWLAVCSRVALQIQPACSINNKKKYVAASQVVFVCMLKSSERPDKNRLYDLYRFSEDEFDPIKPSYWDSW